LRIDDAALQLHFRPEATLKNPRDLGVGKSPPFRSAPGVIWRLPPTGVLPAPSTDKAGRRATPAIHGFMLIRQLSKRGATKRSSYSRRIIRAPALHHDHTKRARFNCCRLTPSAHA